MTVGSWCLEPCYRFNMAVSGVPISGTHWSTEASIQHDGTQEATYMEPTGYGANNALCVPMTVESSSPPHSESLCLLPPASSGISASIQCMICGQYNSEAPLKSSQLAPFSQRSSVDLTGASLELSSVCQSCAGLFQRVDYHHMLASRIRQGLKRCADAKYNSQAPSDLGSVDLQCSLCPVRVSDRRALSAHLGGHLQGGRLPCAACGRSFSGWQTLRRHALAAHQGSLLSRCRRCPAAFNSSAKLVAHKLAQHGAAESLRRHRCPVCRRRFGRGHRYAAHLRTHGAAAADELRRTLAALASGGATEPAEPTEPVAESVDATVPTADLQPAGGHDAVIAEEDDDEEEASDNSEWRASDGEDESSSEDERSDESSTRDGDLVTAASGSDPVAAPADSQDVAPSRQAASGDTESGFPCDQCDKVFKRKQSLERHIGAMHKPSENLRCEECGKSFSIRFYWQKHMNRHRDKREQCTKCRRQFVNGRALKRHKCVAEELAAELASPAQAPAPAAGPAPVAETAECLSGVTGAPCPMCRGRIGDAARGTADPDDPQSVDACRCGLVPTEAASTAPAAPVDPVSAAAVPAAQSQYTCETCGDQFTTLSRLSVHNRAHREPRAHICRTCGSVFATAVELRKHSTQHRERSYQCSVCGKCFRWKNNLDIHARIHADERPYQCDICGHATRCSANLRLHKQRVHSAHRPHVCPLCQKGFKERYNMTIHMRSHTGERPYVCEFCGDGFVTKGKLNSHMSKHSEQRPHECPLCLKAFKTSAILGKHCRKVHGMTVEEAVARVGQPPPPPPPPPVPPPETVPLSHRLATQHYLPEYVAK